MSDEAAIENFREYIRIKTVQPNPDYDGAVIFLKRMADQLQLSCRVHEESWKYDPFAAVMDEKQDIYGRGTQDMKSVAIQYIEAIRRLKAQNFEPLRTIHLSFVPDEEIGGGDGMETLITTQLFKDLNIGFALDEGLASAAEHFMVYYTERSNWWVQISCKGNPGHGSLFIENNAGEKLAFTDCCEVVSEDDVFIVASLAKFSRDKLLIICSAFETLKKGGRRLLLWLKSDSHLTMGDVTSVNLTKVEGGLQVNVVPPEFRAMFDIRVSPYVDFEAFERKLANWCSSAGENVTYSFIKKVDKIPATSTSPNDQWFSAFKNVFNQLDLSMKLDIFPAITDSRFLRQVGLPALGFSPMNHTPVLLHDHNEFLNSQIFLRGIDIYVHLITSLANVSAA